MLEGDLERNKEQQARNKELLVRPDQVLGKLDGPMVSSDLSRLPGGGDI